MTDLTPPPDPTDPQSDLMQVLLRLDGWMTALEQAGHPAAPELAQMTGHLQAIANQVHRAADSLDTLAEEKADLPPTEARLVRLEAQNRAILTRLELLCDRVEEISEWLGAPPRQTVAPT